MADWSQPQAKHEQQKLSNSQPSYTQYHDPSQDIFWAEPVDHSARDSSIEAEVDPPAQYQHSPSTQNAIKRRPVKPITSPSPTAAAGNDSALSPIIPSPLRIRKPKVPSEKLPMRSVRLLIASLGNPPPYHSTRHSAGHILLKHLASRLDLPPLAKSKLLGSGLVSSGADVGRDEYTLWQSGSMMNISGQGTLKAWKQFNSLHPATDDTVTALVILHDELESSSGTIKLRRGESSPKGHNGIKSVQSSLKSAGLLAAMGDRFIKVGIGIGRPLSREKDDVSAWVLGQLTHVEKGKIEAATDSLVAVMQSEIRKLERS
ncbi:hypothetical protein AYO21_10110 [Fonsecaea monophora]|uniref:peptidyl-tRNA hydrolase n=1 Tax=Fonsecaea monophora TaxID=254056 RepID=A0A177EVS5_9EURO|nr:hypothetical protein AYO21_10110 [Fonsecaea monophora]KAH0846109.1 Peptidyl-tRNA hydrolase [Fonsecaea pedrosoi]OAG35716.1 hypothetical protein AYO21_10110 [Fonsecaea monophora]